MKGQCCLLLFMARTTKQGAEVLKYRGFVGII